MVIFLLPVQVPALDLLKSEASPPLLAAAPTYNRQLLMSKINLHIHSSVNVQELWNTDCNMTINLFVSEFLLSISQSNESFQKHQCLPETDFCRLQEATCNRKGQLLRFVNHVSALVPKTANSPSLPVGSCPCLILFTYAKVSASLCDELDGRNYSNGK